jgi:aspartate-semialdehyde dehydrogenase
MDDPDIGPLMNETAVAKQEEHVADALTRGALMLPAASAMQAGPLFFQPTVLPTCRRRADHARGDLRPGRRHRALRHRGGGVARANETEYGLVAYLHTQDPRRIYRASRALQFGMVAVNRTKVTGAPIPFGGMKQSGLGREGSRLGLEAFTDVKYVCRDWA